ncbi:hypothetical protein [Clostridioides sp. ES-S-0001-02]|uniref:hypothetical protein n=1 Tax=Clostridioides sp. ES-S-0001-02 TaxID=2770770 RepID=UPI001D10083E|nr:hypothetical protein [Clostridioides sp. ES-S-0001-02]
MELVTYRNVLFLLRNGEKIATIELKKKFNKDKKVKRSALTRDINAVNTYLPANLKIK